jgi:nucleoside-diphosphate-sugar epimerase
LKLEDRQVLVTGANGFIGSHVVKRLAEDECARVRGFVRNVQPRSKHEESDPRIEYVRGDVTDWGAVVRAAAGCDIVIHAAACQPFAPFPPRARFMAVNVGGTENLLSAFAPGGEGRFLLLSTINVHGIPPPTDASAESPLRYSGDRYSDSKVDGERSAWKLAQERGIALTVVRPGCTFGPNGAAWTLQPLERIRRGLPVLIGGGRGICNLMYVDNLVDLIVAALKSDAGINQSFIGSQRPGVEWRDFFAIYGQMLGMRPRSVPYPTAVLSGLFSSIYERATARPGPLTRPSVAFYTHRVTFNVQKNASLVGQKPRISFEEGMRRTEAWLRERELV